MTSETADPANRFGMDQDEFSDFFNHLLEIISDERDFLKDMYLEFRKEYAMGRDVQSEINEFYDNNAWAFVFMSMGELFDMDKLIEEYSDDSNDQAADDALDSWNSMKWASDSAQAYNEYSRGADYWTNKSIDFLNEDNNETMAQVKKLWGLDTVYDQTIPLDLFLADAVSRVENVCEWWESLDDGNYPRIYEDDISDVEELPNRLREVADNLEENLEKTEVLEGGSLEVAYDV